ncbi:MAG: helix-hairpin-helix domain-containing protein [Paludibacteraceae bacterium]|nr:helix-hairpin-helix domain-containing protein [Paludibacteraceae bacterium]
MLILLSVSLPVFASLPPVDIDAVTDDIYSFLSETEDIDYEDLQERLLSIAEQPINLNSATYEDLSQLGFLSDKQIDDILLYVYRHPMISLYELQLIGSLRDYEIRNLLPFVCIQSIDNDSLSIRDVFRFGRHELSMRVDGRYLEDPKRNKQNDPVYSQLRYRFKYKDHVRFGVTVQRPTGAEAKEMLYGGYLQLKKIGALQTFVAGNYQASFGQGLVAATPYHFGKSMYVMNAATTTEGLRYHSSASFTALRGAGATVTAGHWQASGWYSFLQPNDSLRHHLIGFNTTYKRGNLKVGFTMSENIYSDSVRYYFVKAAYNQHYFRGTNQWIGGVNFRYRLGIADIFGEAATTQNLRHWGYGAIVGTRLNPIPDLGLIVLYRYYSPYFDNTQGYAFSETSRLNDENGLYAGMDIGMLRHWRFAWYGDVFRFDGVKYGIPYSPSWGYDAMGEIEYRSENAWRSNVRLRSRQKGGKENYSLRYSFTWEQDRWRLVTRADGNIAHTKGGKPTFGYSLTQDVQYAWVQVPLTLQVRLQGFRVRDWDNRIYCYENDVLYSFSIPALYGIGGQAYINLRWQIIEQLSLYFRVSEKVYAPSWVREHSLAAVTRTDLHLLLRATF